MSEVILSPFSFYGGKSRMASMICGMLDYKNTELYIEPFGGACRVLLNKPRHKGEIYNDYGYGLCSFFQTIGNPELSKELIQELYRIKPDKAVFREKQKFKAWHEMWIDEWMKYDAKKFVYSCSKKYKKLELELKKLHSQICKKDYGKIIPSMQSIINSNLLNHNDVKRMGELMNLYIQYWKIAEPSYKKAYTEASIKANKNKVQFNSQKKINEYCHNWALEQLKDCISDYDPSGGRGHDDVEMAVATYITYAWSRDGMGKDFSSAKLNNLNAYYNSLEKLDVIAERMKGVVVTQTGAMDYIIQYKDNPKVMMYLDPSYLNDDRKDLGAAVYNRSSDYNEHKRYAKLIQNSKAKIILSNYDIDPYKTYLDEAHGWKKEYFETTTGVGSKKDNKRTEVLWYNY